MSLHLQAPAAGEQCSFEEAREDILLSAVVEMLEGLARLSTSVFSKLSGSRSVDWVAGVAGGLKRGRSAREAQVGS